MDKIENLEDFYLNKFNWIPDNFRNEIGHFNVFPIDPFVGKKAKPIPYRRRDFYKMTFVVGCGKVHYADKVVTVQKQALSFSNPNIPYKWDNLEEIRSGFFCIFNHHFFHQFGDLNQYAVFQPNGNPIFELTDEEAPQIKRIFERMLEEIQSDYIHKYDVLRNMVFELLHFAMKHQTSAKSERKPVNASQRIATMFIELLERQFPFDDNHQKINLRSASDYALQLNLHVNHLNRAIKDITQKTTTEIIAERLLQEAKVLLKHSTWNVSDISYALGFTEVTHFNNFFKKHIKMSPLQFRNKL